MSHDIVPVISETDTPLRDLLAYADAEEVVIAGKALARLHSCFGLCLEHPKYAIARKNSEGGHDFEYHKGEYAPETARK